MTVEDLLKDFKFEISAKALLQENVTGLELDSRKVREGDIFIAKKGPLLNGHDYLKDVFQKGVKVALVSEWESFRAFSEKTVYLEDLEYKINQILMRFYGDHSRQLKVIGVTGTNGKSTTAFALKELLRSCGKCGFIGTTGVMIDGDQYEAANTTPSFKMIQNYLHQMAERGFQYAALEVSSHALEQKRIDGMTFDARIFTNLTQDHLDYHPSMEAYFEAKSRLFTEFSSEALSIINYDDAYGRRLYDSLEGSKRSFGFDVNADYRIQRVSYRLAGMEFCLEHDKRGYRFSTRLIGKFNVYNLVGAIIYLLEKKMMNEQEINTLLQQFVGAPGRLERFQHQPDDPSIFVDYAHTPDAVQRVLVELRRLIRGKLVVLLGCGGDRDRKKRPLMGNTAASLCDHLIITDDNPRSEDPRLIVEDILSGIDIQKRSHCEVIHQRDVAIKRGWELIRASEDAMVILGKGHEDYQIYGNQKKHFSDREEVMRLLDLKDEVVNG